MASSLERWLLVRCPSSFGFSLQSKHNQTLAVNSLITTWRRSKSLTSTKSLNKHEVLDKHEAPDKHEVLDKHDVLDKHEALDKHEVPDKH